MLRDLVEKPVEMREYFSPEAKNLLNRLLDKNPEKRLGSEGAEAVMKHPFFKTLDWD